MFSKQKYTTWCFACENIDYDNKNEVNSEKEWYLWDGLEFMPELKQKWGYPIVLILMAIVTGVIYQWFRKKKWL